MIKRERKQEERLGFGVRRGGGRKDNGEEGKKDLETRVKEEIRSGKSERVASS